VLMALASVGWRCSCSRRYIEQSQEGPKSNQLKLALMVVGVLLVLVSLRWTWIFAFTNYRHHLAPTILPLAAVCFGLGLLLVVCSFTLKTRKFGN
jgi:hypothetical protein